MSRMCWVFVLPALAFAPLAQGRIVYVDQDVSAPVHDGTSWSSAYVHIYEGINDGSATEVWVTAGRYIERFTVSRGVAVYGSFAGTETSRGQRDLKANVTLIDGSSNYDTVTCQSTGVTVDGFQVRGGRYGIFVKSGSAALSNNTVSGAAMFGVAIGGGSATLTNNVLFGNTKHGVYLSDGTATLNNNTITGNGTHGVYALMGQASLSNNIVAYNSDTGVYRVALATLSTFSHNDLYGNATANYQGFTPPAGKGNISQDPLFVKRAADDLRLTPGSPCIDAGDDTVPAGGMDRDGAARIWGAHVDMGAYEYSPAGPLPFATEDVKRCLSIVAGFSAATPDDLSRLDVEAGTGRLDVRDALHLARKVAGLDVNP